MSRDENELDQPALWDEFTDSEPLRQRSRALPPSTAAARETPSTPTAKAQPAVDRLWTVDEVAAFLGVPKKTIYSWRTASKGPKGFRVGKHLRWHPRTVFEWSLRLEGEQ